MAGFRVHERFFQLEAPNEAVARTSEVAGGIVLTGSGDALKVARACVSVSTSSLHSVDVVPGLYMAGRDPYISIVLDSDHHPDAVFRAIDVSLPANATSGQKTMVALNGELTLHGVTRPVSPTLDGVLQGNQIQLAGGFPIELGDYGMYAPENQMAAVDSKVTIEFQLFLDRR